MTTKRAAVYVRVSTETQRRDGSSLKTQTERCLEYVRDNGMSRAVVLDDAISGTTPIFERPGGRELKRWIDAGAIDAVVMYTSDRMSRRDDDGVDYLLLRGYLADHNVELHFCDTGLDRDDFAGKVVSSITRLLASEERNKITDRTRRGRADRANGGRVFYSGRILYGYMRDGKLKESKIVICQDEAVIVVSIFKSYVKGLMNLRDIARELNDKGIPTPRHGKGWTEGTVKRILDNVNYTGVWRYRDVTISVPELKIIERSTYDAAQERREKNKETAQRHQRREYVLTGHLFCTCGRRMCGGSGHGAKNHPYYACNNRARATIQDCNESYIRADTSDQIVWAWVEQQLDRRILERGIDAMIARKEKEVAPSKERLQQVADLISKTDKRIVRLVAEMVDIDDDEARAAVKENVRQLTRQKAGLIQERDTLLQRVNDTQITPETKQAILETVEDARQQLHGATFKQKRFIMKKLDVRAQLRYDEAGRWLDVTCGVRPEGTALPIGLQSS